jgi:hypothetical protein
MWKSGKLLEKETGYSRQFSDSENPTPLNLQEVEGDENEMKTTLGLCILSQSHLYAHLDFP